MSEPLTLILPLHNAERILNQTVVEILDLAANFGLELQVALLDDGSTDDTYELACELARAYPQLRVLRQPFRRGLGPALDRVRRELRPSAALVHDGDNAIDLEELAGCLRNCRKATPEWVRPARRSAGHFDAIAKLDTQLQQAHRRTLSFRWLSLGEAYRGRRAAFGGPMLGGADSATCLDISPSLS